MKFVAISILRERSRTLKILLILILGGYLFSSLSCNGSGTTTIAATTTQTAATTTSFTLQPDAGSFLTDRQGVSSEVLLKNVQVDKGISYEVYGPPPNIQPVQMGDPIWVITGTVQNQHLEYKYIAIWANGYDDKGNTVAVTLDSAHIVGQILLHLENEETGEFTLHLNMAANLKSIHIFAHSYAIRPP